MRIRVCGVFEQSGEVLCTKYVYGGKEVLALPGGGVDKDAAVEESLIDEWKEELGVKVEVGNIIFVGEAHGDKRHPQTLHIVFLIEEIYGTPKIRTDQTNSKEIVWVPFQNLAQKDLYPDVGVQLADYFLSPEKPTVPFIKNCMERGYF